MGATGGLGSAISRELSLRGDRLVPTGRDPARLQELSEALPGSASTLLDLGHPDDGDRLVATVMTVFGRLDVLVNAAGVVAFGTLADTLDVVIEELFHQRGRAAVAPSPMPAVAPGQPGHCGRSLLSLPSNLCQGWLPTPRPRPP